MFLALAGKEKKKMKRSFIFAVIAVLIMAWTCPATADTLFGVTAYTAGPPITPSYLYTISSDLNTYTNIGKIQAPSGWQPSILDIAYSPVDQTMYAINSKALIKLDIQNIVADTITASIVSNQGAARLQGLAVAPDGTIYAASSKTASASGDLYRFDTGTNSWQLIGSLGTGSGAATDYMGNTGDLAFDSSGNLYGSVTWVNHKPSLVSINTTTGAATSIGAFGTIPNPGTPPPTNITVTNDGLAFWGTTLYGAFNSNLGTYLIDPSTGSVVSGSFHATGINFNGLTLAPIPGAVLLLGTGLTFMAALGLRKKS
jgi:hypothetical protein